MIYVNLRLVDVYDGKFNCLLDLNADDKALIWQSIPLKDDITRFSGCVLRSSRCAALR